MNWENKINEGFFSSAIFDSSDKLMEWNEMKWLGLIF